MNTLFITRKWPPAVGGMEKYSVQLSDELSKLTNLSILFLAGKKNGKPPHSLSLFLFMVRCAWYLLFKSRNFNVVHVGDLVLWPLAYIAKLSNTKTRILITAYGLDIVYGSQKGLIPKIYKTYLAIGVRLCNKSLRIIAISHATAFLCRSVGFSDVRVVPLGVNVDKICFKNEILTSKPYVLFVGRLVKRKGCRWFVENVLPSLEPHINLVVVGKGWDPNEVSAITNNPRVEYKKYVSDEQLSRLRKESLIVIMPNIPTGGKDIEGFGLTALEATVDGGVLLASGIEGIIDAVINSETGFLLPTQNSAAWIDKIMEVQQWTDVERTAFILNAQNIIKEKYSWTRVAYDTFLCYQPVD